MRLRFVLLGLAASFAAVACDSCCAEPLAVIGNEPVCTLADGDKCDEFLTFRFGACVESGCQEDTECCPGTRCRAAQNSCFPILLDPEYECDTSADCPDPAQRCVSTRIGERDPLPTCVYETCTGDDQCGFGRVCFAGRCVKTAPCSGSCPDGSACDLITGRCAPFPDDSPGCAEACNGLRAFSNPETMSGDQCCGLACTCLGLPPIVSTRYGRYSRIAVALDEALVSAYDAEYGDLVLVHYKLDGSFSRLQYLDGVPSTGAVVADPLGPRGGVADVGDNVGTHTSIAVDSAGLARIAYHDVDGRSLKVAVENADGSFSSHFVDGGDGNAKVGQFTDMAITGDGTIYVSYLAHDALLAGVTGRATGLKLAKSRTPTPASAADWDLLVVDARPMFDPCNGACTGGTQCVLNGGPVCVSATTGCNPSCGSSEVCADTGGGTLECLPPPLPQESPEVPRGRGLYTGIALDGATPVIVAYDSIDGDLRVATVAGTTPTVVVLDGDGNAGRRSGDVGRFPTVAKIGQNLTIAWEDFTRHEVRAWQGALAELGTAGSYSQVDAGFPEAGRTGKAFVGAGARLAQGAASAVIAMQDASTLDLKLASQSGATWTSNRLITDGAHGFYSDVAIVEGNAYIVSVEARLDERGIEASRVGLTVQPAP